MLYIFIYIILSIIYFRSFSTQQKISTPQLAFILFVLALIVGFGDMLGGYDRYIYCDLFDSNADRIRAGGPFWNPNSPLMGYKREASYVVWNCLLAYITENRYIFILITTLFVYTMIFFSLKKYIIHYPFALLLFMGLWFFFTFTYLRQVMAVSFAWFSYRYILKKKFIPFLICWFIAYKFHNSAIIFLPFYFVPKRKWKPKTIIIILFILVAIGGTGAPMALYSTYGGLSETSDRANAYGFVNEGFRIEYLLECIVFLYFIFKRYDDIPEDREHLVFLNAALIFCAVLLTFIQSSNAGRQSWYYMIGMIYTLTHLCSIQKKFSSYTKLIYFIITALFIRFIIGWGILISPYKTFLTNGNRDGDPVNAQFEYDQNYAKDKFYRLPFSIYIPQ